MGKINKKFKINKKAVIIVAIILFCLTLIELIPIANAADAVGTAAGTALGGAFSLLFPNLLGNIGKDILMTLINTVHTVLNWLIKAGAAFFEGITHIGFDNNIVEGIKTGWTTVRDVTNMFFILFMIVIAFGTILRTAEYGVAKLLPKIIIVALLINFSFVLCSIVVDFSNITADFFIKDIQGKISGEKNSISATFADAMNVGGVYRTFTTCEDYAQATIADCAKISISRMFTIAYDCPYQGQIALNECKKKGVGNVKLQGDLNDTNFLSLFLSLTVGSVVMLIAAFVFFAGGIMLLARIIAIWILITLSPLALICLVLPALRNHWVKWRGTFLKWCFFGPIYAFFIWMATKIAVEGIGEQMGLKVKEYTNITGDFTYFSNEFITNPGQQLVRYFVISGFLIGGLLAAQQLSIYGSKTAIAIGQKWSKGARDWAVKRPLTWSGKTLGAGILTAGGSLFKGTKWGGRMSAKAIQLKQSLAQTKENQAYKKLLETMTKEDKLREVESAIGVRRLLATRDAMESGLLAKTENRAAVREAITTLKGYGMMKEAGDLEEARAELAKNVDETVGKVISKNEQNKWKESVFKSPEGASVIRSMIKFSGDSVVDFVEKFKKLNDLARKEAENQMKSMFNNDFTDKENIQLRIRYAAVSGNVYNAFKNERGEIAEPDLQQFIEKMQPVKFADLDTRDPNSTKYIAKYVSAPTAIQIARYLSDDARKRFVEGFTAPVKEELKKNNQWASYIKKEFKSI